MVTGKLVTLGKYYYPQSRETKEGEMLPEPWGWGHQVEAGIMVDVCIGNLNQGGWVNV